MPVTVADRVDDASMALLRSLGHLLAPDDARVLAWMDELEKGMAVDRANIFFSMANITHMTGDIDYAIRLADRAETAGLHPVMVGMLQMQMYANLGYISKSQHVGRDLFSIERQNIGVGILPLICCGAFSKIVNLLDAADAAKIDLSQIEQIEAVRLLQVNSAMLQDDKDYAAALDIAGTILRENKLLWLGRAPSLTFDEEMQTVAVRFRVEASPAEARNMTNLYLERWQRSQQAELNLTVRFIGTVRPQAA